MLHSKEKLCSFMFHGERYSALVWGQSLDELVLASGTVFNQILFWHVRDDEGAGHFRVRINFVGHQVS